MTKRKLAAEETCVCIPKESGGNFRHLRVTVPSQIKGVNSKIQLNGKSLLVMASQTSKCNLKNVFTDTIKILPSATEKNIPKTKLSGREKSTDRRSPSPRLKNFPAEKIKKIDGNVLLQHSMPHNEPIVTSHPEQYDGHGDALATPQQIQITPRHQSKNTSKSQQNISYFYQVENTNQSDGVLPSHKIVIPTVQSHRPFVPNFSHGATILQPSPKKQVTPRPIFSHMPTAYPTDISKQSNQEQKNFKAKNQEILKREQNQHQESPQISSEILESDYVKQPVGGRVAAVYRQAVSEQKPILQKETPHNQIQQKQQSQLQQYQIPEQQIQQQLPLIPPVSHDRALVWPNAGQHSTVPRIENIRQQPNDQEVDQQLYQQLQHNTAFQQQMQQRAMLHQQQMMNQMQQRTYYDYYNQRNQETSPGITSPQDLSVSREIYHQTGTHHMQVPVNSQEYLQNLIPSNKAHSNVRTQLNPFAFNQVNPHPNQYQSNVQTKWQQSVPINYNTLHNHNNLKSNETSLQSNQNSLQTKQNIQINENNLQNSQNNYRMKSIIQQQIEALDPQQQKQPTGEKVYHFTPEMLKDQEQLLATMQQQGVPEDVMQRQFQLLLSEQKKQLAYLVALTQKEEKVNQKITSSVFKKSEIEVDEKPDWMSHITPPRIPYCELTKIKNSSAHNIQGMQQQTDQNYVLEHQQYQHQNHQCQQEQPPNHQYQIQQKQFQPHQQQISHQQNQIKHQQQFQHQQQVPHQLKIQHQQPLHHQRQVQYQQQIQHHQNQVGHQQHHNHQIQQQQQCYHQHHIQHQHPQAKNQHQQNSYQNCQHEPQMMDLQRSDLHVAIPYPYHPHPPHSLSMPSLNNATSPIHLQSQYYSPQYYHQHPQFQQQMWQNWQQISSVTPNSNLQHHSEMNSHQLKKNSKAVEPSSLRQLRLYKEVIQPQKRNNGLQDLDSIKEALETLKNAKTKKGLEYLENLNKKEPIVRLNGVQEPGEIPKNLLHRSPTECLQQIPKQVSANGLENQRNPDNPQPPPDLKIRHLDNQMTEYPRTKKPHQLPNYTYIAERENGSVDSNSYHHQCHYHPQVNYAYNQVPLKNWSPIPNLGYIHQQQFHNNRQRLENNGQEDLVPEIREISGKEYVKQPGGDQQNIKTPFNQYGGVMMRPNANQELRIIGGVSYLARKPNSIPNAPIYVESFNDNNYLPQNVVS